MSISKSIALRQDRLQWAASTWDSLPFDTNAARSYGQIFSIVRSSGRLSRSRGADLLIAATAAAHGLALYTRNPEDFKGLEEVLTVVGL